MKHVTPNFLALIGGLVLALASWAATGLPNRAEPIENLVVSGQPSAAQLEALSEEGFVTIINLRRDGEFDDFDEEELVSGLGMKYVHIPVRNVKSIDVGDAEALHAAVSNAKGPVLLHCTIGWRAAGLLAIERYLKHGASPEEAHRVAVAAHMEHAGRDVDDWIRANSQD